MRCFKCQQWMTQPTVPSPLKLYDFLFPDEPYLCGECDADASCLRDYDTAPATNEREE